MKVCTYLELENKFNHTGIGNASRMHRKSLESAGIDWTKNPDDKYDILHIYTIGPKSFYLANKAKRKGKPVVMHVFTTPGDFKNSFWFSNMLYPAVRKWLQKLYSQADLLICPSPYVLHELKKISVKTKTTVMGCAIDIEKIRKGQRKKYRERYNLEGTIPYSVGVVFPRKGVETFVDIAEKFDNQFVWFGKIFKGFLAPNMKLSPPKNMIFTDFVDDIASAHAAGDIFLFPTYNENFGLVLFEAMCLGKPAIIRDMPCFDWIDENVCLKAKNEREFVENLEYLMDNRERKRMGNRGKKFAEQFSVERIGKTLKNTYEALI